MIVGSVRVADDERHVEFQPKGDAVSLLFDPAGNGCGCEIANGAILQVCSARSQDGGSQREKMVAAVARRQIHAWQIAPVPANDGS